MTTMPARDVAHGIGSREANVLAAADMQWLSESIDARGGVGPSVDSHVMRAADLQDIFTGHRALTGLWIDPDFSAVDIWDGPMHFASDEVRAKDLMDCPSGVAAGQPMYGSHMRTAFWNAMQREVLSSGQDEQGVYVGVYSEAGKTFSQIGSRYPYAPGANDIYCRRVTTTTTEGFVVSGGACSSAGVLPDAAAAMDVEAVFAVVSVTVGSQSHAACMMIGEYEASGGVLSCDLLAVRDACMRALRHFGWSEGSAYGWAGMYGLLPIMRVREVSRLSDIGWSWSPG